MSRDDEEANSEGKDNDAHKWDDFKFTSPTKEDVERAEQDQKINDAYKNDKEMGAFEH